MISKKIIYGCEANGDKDSAYLIRYTLFESNLLQICLHVFIRSDNSEHHDHPWNFLSIILWRGYNEETVNGKSRKWPLMFLYRPATYRHRVELINEKPAVTLVFMSKRIREWGFYTPQGWMKWSKYFIKNKC